MWPRQALVHCALSSVHEVCVWPGHSSLHLHGVRSDVPVLTDHYEPREQDVKVAGSTGASMQAYTHTLHAAAGRHSICCQRLHSSPVPDFQCTVPGSLPCVMAGFLACFADDEEDRLWDFASTPLLSDAKAASSPALRRLEVLARLWLLCPRARSQRQSQQPQRPPSTGVSSKRARTQRLTK